MITKIKKESSGIISYLNASDERVFSTVAQASVADVAEDGLKITDTTGQQVFIYANSITHVNDVAVNPITQQALWELLDTDVFQGSSAASGGSGAVAFGKDDSSFATVSTTYVDNLPSLTQTFEAGTYQIDHYCAATGSGTVRADFNIVIDTVQVMFIKEGLFSNPVNGVLCSTIQELTAGEHTIDFQVRSESAAVTVTTRNRYYTITKIA